MNDRYKNAYGSYRGGYGNPRGRGFQGPPGRGPPPFRRPPGYGPPPPFGPPLPQPFFRGRPPPFLNDGMGFDHEDDYYDEFEGPGYNIPMPPRLPLPRPKQNQSVKFLLRCGVAMNVIKSTPPEVLDLIESEKCNLCGHNFESFSVARMHYLSKNHQKNQKKWMAQKIDMRLLNPNETPLKARELYCELCDVQITSKSHADAHYAGKQHRSIVDGHKNPKNPVLLQPGMEKRIQQLLRRERKHLKKSDEDAETSTSKEAKAHQTELYCEVCNTYVTCTEQMTAHLNGKRHLNKEKQYILRKMRGEEDPNNGNADNEEAAADEDAYDEENMGAGVEVKGDGEKKYDGPEFIDGY